MRVFAHKDFSVNKIRQIIGMHPTTIKKYWQLLENYGLIKYEGSQHTNLDWNTNFKLRKKDIATYYSIPKKETYITISREILNKMQNCEVSEQEIKIYLFLIKLQEQFDGINLDDKTFSFKDLRQLLQLRKETSNHKSILNSFAQLKSLGLIDYIITENDDNNLKVKVPTFHLINVNF